MNKFVFMASLCLMPWTNFALAHDESSSGGLGQQQPNYDAPLVLPRWAFDLVRANLDERDYVEITDLGLVKTQYLFVTPGGQEAAVVNFTDESELTVVSEDES